MPLTKEQKLIYDKCLGIPNIASATLGDEYYYDSLPQCIIDAVYSIGVRYNSTRKTVMNYCNKNDICCVSSPLGESTDSYTIKDLLNSIESNNISGDFGATELFRNKQKTSTRNGILKAEAVYRFASVLSENEIQSIKDIRAANAAKIEKIESEIKKIPGQKSGISFSYFLMLCGDDNHMKIDRWLLRFVGDALGIKNYNNVSQAYSYLISVCAELKKTYTHLTPRLLDYIIWSYMK